MTARGLAALWRRDSSAWARGVTPGDMPSDDGYDGFSSFGYLDDWAGWNRLGMMPRPRPARVEGLALADLPF